MIAFVLVLQATSAAAAEPTARHVTLGMHARLVLDRDMQRISVGNPRVVEIELINSRELLALGRGIGRTNLLIWYTDGTTEDVRWSVQRDFSLLGQVLRDIHPSLRAESAPDRDAIILRGNVPDVRYARLAEAAAGNYLRAGGPRGQEGDSLVLPARGADASADGAPAPEEGDAGADDALPVQASGLSRTTGRGASIINLIQVGDLPASFEQRIRAAIDPIGGHDVTVRRIVRGQMPNDTADTFVLEGEVDGQVELSRILIAASTVVTGRTTRDIQVLANEAGALATGTTGGGGSSGGFGGGGGGRSIGAAGLRNNQIGSNIARAKALSTAGGRILAFVRVRDLPQVRVQVRVFEINRTRLKDWLPAINAVKVDQGQTVQPPLIPGVGPNNPGQSPDYGGTSWQMATRLLQGLATSQWQVVASDFAIDIFMALLESEGVARSLARPTLTVLSGESATFNVGGAIPIERTLTTAAGNQSFTDVLFQEFGITLSVRPLVGDDDIITMDVSPDISFPDPALTAALDEGTSGGASTAAFETRTLSTSTRLADGAVLAIGGLLQQEQSVDSSYTPKVHEVPGAGWFAKSLSRSGDETEVVILLSPTIVRDRIDGVELWAYPDADDLLPPPRPESEKS